MNKYLRNIFSLVMNVIVVGILIYVMINYLALSDSRGPSCFAFYTTDSNLIFAISCLVMIPYNILTIVKKEHKIPTWVTLFKFYGTTIVAVTFFVVLLLLGPLAPNGFISLYKGMPFYLHLVVPVIAMVSFISFDLYNEIKIKHLFYNLILTLTYGIFYIIWVFGLKKQDFYSFFAKGTLVSIAIYIGIFSLCFGLGALLRFLNKIRNN